MIIKPNMRSWVRNQKVFSSNQGVDSQKNKLINFFTDDDEDEGEGEDPKYNEMGKKLKNAFK